MSNVFVYYKKFSIRKSAIISVTDVDDQMEEGSDEKQGTFTVTLLNGYPITFSGPYEEIQKEHEEFMKEVTSDE